MIQIFSNTLDAEEELAVRDVFRSKWLGSGEKVKELEGRFKDKIGKACLSTNSCTSALVIALKAIGIGEGDEVIIPTINFVGCANAVLMLGAYPVFCDVRPDSFNIDPTDFDDKITRDTRAVIVLHYGGHPAEMNEIKSIAVEHGIDVIEDSANSVSSFYKGKHCGTLGSAGVFSFDSMKTLVTGDGGMLSISDEFYNAAYEYRYLGLPQKSKSGIDSQNSGTDRWWEFEINRASDRNTMNDITAAIGIEQLRKLPYFIERRRAIWNTYQEAFSKLNTPPEPLPDCESSYYLYWLKIKDRDRFARYLVDNGIYCTFRYYPLHMVKYYESDSVLPVAEEINETAINIPLHQNLSDEDVDYIIDRVNKFT